MYLDTKNYSSSYNIIILLLINNCLNFLIQIIFKYLNKIFVDYGYSKYYGYFNEISLYYTRILNIAIKHFYKTID